MKPLIYFAIGCILMIITSLTVLRPWEEDLIAKCQTEYKQLLDTSKNLANDYNKVMDLLRESYNNGQESMDR